VNGWLDIVLRILVTINQILTSGIAITAFALLLYALTFNLKDRVARSFAIILMCVVVLFSADAFGSTSQSTGVIDFWLKVQWVAILFLPASYLNFSDALLATTGKPSRWRRKWAIRIAFLLGVAFFVALVQGSLVGPVQSENAIVPHHSPTPLTEAFTLFYIVVMVMSWFNFIRAYRRTLTHTSKRRMVYLTTAALGPAFGSFPFLLYGSSFASNAPILFWFIAIGANVILTVSLIAMAYSVAYFGVPWPDRLVKSRLFKWLLRGPITASLTLAVVTIIRRIGELYGTPYSAFVPISMVICVLISEYLITLFFPALESWLFFGNDVRELEILRSMEEKLITRSDLDQFLEMVLASVCDRLQAGGAYLAASSADGLELISETGISNVSNGKMQELTAYVRTESITDLTVWHDDTLFPIMNGTTPDHPMILGFLGIVGFDKGKELDGDDLNALRVLANRAAMALKDRDAQEQIFRSLELMTPQVDLIQQLRAAGRYDRNGLLKGEESFEPTEMAQWIKDALTHYWGGPKLSESPLLQLQVVKKLFRSMKTIPSMHCAVSSRQRSSRPDRKGSENTQVNGYCIISWI